MCILQSNDNNNNNNIVWGFTPSQLRFIGRQRKPVCCVFTFSPEHPRWENTVSCRNENDPADWLLFCTSKKLENRSPVLLIPLRPWARCLLPSASGSERHFCHSNWRHSTLIPGLPFLLPSLDSSCPPLTEQEAALPVEDHHHSVLQLARQVEGEPRPRLVGLRWRNLSRHVVQNVPAEVISVWRDKKCKVYSVFHVK